MKLRNLALYATLGASALAYSASARASTAVTPEQQAKVDGAMEEMYRDKPKYEQVNSPGRSSNDGGGFGFDLWSFTTMLGFAFFVDKFGKERKR